MSDSIQAAAERFRRALEEGGLTHVTLQAFPRGSCGDASELLGEYLSGCGLGDWTYRWGVRKQQTHAWLEQGGVIVDITADQFGEGMPSVLITRDRRWHEAFEPAGAGRRAGLDYYYQGSPGAPLRADFAVLKDRADAGLRGAD